MTVQAQLMAAHAALGAGDAVRALGLAELVLQANPAQPDALQLFAGAALQLGRADQAVAALRRASQARPDSPDIAFNLGIAEQAAGEPAAAQAAFERCLSLRPARMDAQRGRARSAAMAGDWRAALDASERILAQHPDDADASDDLAHALSGMGRDDEALDAANRAIARTPERLSAWRTLARVHEQAGRIDEALAALTRAAQAGIEAHAMALARGHLAYRAGRFATAAAAFSDAAVARSDSGSAWNNLAASQIALDRVDEAIASARRACGLAPGDAGMRMTLAAALSHSRDALQLDESLSLCAALLDLRPDHAAAHDCAAIVRLKRGETADALAHAQRAVAIEPGEAAYNVTLARVLEQSGDLAGAEAVLIPLAQAPAPVTAVIRQLGHVQLRRHRSEAALATLDEVWRRAPGDQGAIAERAVAIGATTGWAAAESWIGLHEWVRPVPLAVPTTFRGTTDFLAALAADIRRHSQLRYEPVGLVARGGYLTGDLLADDTPAISGFADSLRAALAAYIDSLPDVPGHPFLGRVPRGPHLMHVWATRVREQGVIDTHLHEGSWLSGAYYVELPPVLGDEDTAGWIEFGQPYAGLPAPPAERLLRVRPRVGQMLFFPSYFFHRTLPFAGDGERISISFDLGPV
jgi:uncharacterized protein (TIGR02466 family)